VKEPIPIRPKDAARLDELGDEIQERIEERDAIQNEPRLNRFEKISDDRFRLNITGLGITFEIDRLRREHQELVGELSVRCNIPGARTYDGNLLTADFNLSSARARSDRAKLLDGRARIEGLDWTGYLEELCQRVLAAERQGAPAVDLRTIERPKPDDMIRVEGLVLPRRHPTTIYGDGGAAKSYLALHLAGCLAKKGFVVGLFDWELAAEDHRDRLERLFDEMPLIFYARCDRPLVYERDRLRRIVRENRIDYAIYDSVAFACDGPPKDADVASRYFGAVRQIGAGSLQIAHITKGEDSEEKPFGSVFWANGSRATYFAKLAERSSDDILQVGLFPKKANLGRLTAPTAFEFAFTENKTSVRTINPADNPDLVVKLSIRLRMAHVLKHGAMSFNELEKELGAKPDTVRRTVRRCKDLFRVIDGGKVGLCQRDSGWRTQCPD
jgi:hypothetical protein